MASNPGLVAAVAALAGGKFDAAKHARGAGGKFTGMGGGAKKPGGSVAMAHGIFDKLKGKPKSEMLAAAKAAGINDNTAKTQLYHWQKKQATAALAGNEAPTKADLQAAAAKALGVKQAAKEPAAAPKPAATPPKPEPKAAPAVTTPVAEKPAEKTGPDLDKLGPTKYVHALADHMKGAEKKAVVAAAVSAGVNKSTAGVQYGKWAAKQSGTPPQMEKSPEPKVLQAKQPQDMSDKELDKALDSYQGKLNYTADSAKYAPKPYNSQHDYQPHEGGKALTAKMGAYDLYTHPTQHKTFYKDGNGSVYEHVGTTAGPMIKVDGHSIAEFHYDPAANVLYSKVGGVLKPAMPKTPVFKSQQKAKTTIANDSWANVNGVHNANSYGVTPEVEKAWKNSGVTYDGETEGVVAYTGHAYTDMNDLLRMQKTGFTGKGTGYETKWINQIDAAISKSKFKQDTIMWRGVGLGGTVWNGAPPPAAVTDHGFTSTSYRPDVAKGFSDGKTLFRVKVPAGFPGLNVAIGQPSGGGLEGLKGEAEVMLPRGTTYKVVNRHAKAAGDYDVVDLEPVLPQWYIDKYGAPK